jgi:hypothetical protein
MPKMSLALALPDGSQLFLAIVPPKTLPLKPALSKRVITVPGESVEPQPSNVVSLATRRAR